ncbi:transcriptional regulator, GntR family with aminotransferase domain [Segniliparus rotundus DSM 44985]|uniref:Transcriptional regulator, GntR family with aminotransferase domain n=1 Tax=Segniliparus rotundus (strain ATCC BAA-972 / CDC 1076 / CIP 108378 / DSM 44985 / JCM 13578) TaxID=640132 RepID=D6Z793_SEGRD|nr:PLP-dependent aminotransferase family protein [Segniliparus rotundus]ADG97823.1 transcriptional regulator, GntR family with aminotransferase domain [Segniliparus rotundus DSM 44985]
MDATTLARHLGNWRTAPDAGPVYHALADAIRLSVLDGRLPLGAQLPSERTLAQALRVSRTTVTSAYGELRESGHLVGRQGARSATALPQGNRANPADGPIPVPPTGIDLANAALAAPEGVIFESYREAVDSLCPYLASIGLEHFGLPQLREAVAQRYRDRGLPTSPDQIMITNGAQHGLALLLATYVAPLDRVLVEHPTYMGLLEAVRRHGAKPVPVGVRSVTDHEARLGVEAGWETSAIDIAMRQTAPNLAVLTIDNHNPTGLTMPIEDRTALAEAVLRTRTLTVVDESLLDIWHEHAPPAPFASLMAERPELAITLGSMSKSFWGGLRLGWIRAEAEVIRRVAATRPAIDLGTPIVEQLAATHLLANADHILPNRRELAVTRRAFLTAELARALPDWEPTTGKGGLSLWVQLPKPMSSALAAAAARIGLAVTAGPRFGTGGAFERHLRIPHTQPEPVLAQGVELLERAWRSVTGGSVETTPRTLVS